MSQQHIPVDLSYTLPCFADLSGRVAIITGASRGIGRACALKLAKQGCHICIAAKTTEPAPTLPGTIYTVAKEVEALGVQSLPFKVDVRDAESVQKCIDAVVAKWGRIDILINNASALWWQDIKDTPVKRFDLITQINVRGSFLMAKACLPHMERNNFGRVVCMSPPIQRKGFAGMTAYNVSKMGMTMVAMGVAEEYADKNITGNSLWPATVVESLAAANFKLGDRKLWRKAEVIADATVGIISEGGDFTGNMLIDDEYLRATGLQDKDFVRYRCDPDFEPPRALAREAEDFDPKNRKLLKRGSVTRLDKDLEQSSDIWGGVTKPTSKL